MCKKMILLTSLVFVLALTSSTWALVVTDYQVWTVRTQIADDLEGGFLEIQGPDGYAHFTARVDQDAADVTIGEGGILETNDTYKLPDGHPEPDPTNVFVNGTWYAHDIESFGQERAAMMYIGANGVLNLETGLGGTGDNERYDPEHWVEEGSLVVSEDLDPNLWRISIEDLGGGAARVTVIEAKPYSRNPIPASKTEQLCPDVALSWTSGEFAAEHDVYLSTDVNDVRDANTTVDPNGAYMGRFPDPNYDPPGLLEWGQTYYWRVDEVNDADIWKGLVWQFTINDGNAFNPYPDDDQVRVPLDAVLTWTPGCFVDSHDVYLGTDLDDVNNAGTASSEYIGNQPVEANSYDPCGLDYGTWYYWRIDEVSGGDTRRGTTLSFKAVSIIPDPNFLLWYKLDETEGDEVEDSSGHDFYGDGDGIDDEDWDPADGRFPGCIAMDDNIRIDIDTEILNHIGNEITIAAWVKGPLREGSENWLFGTGTSNEMAMMAAIPDQAGLAIVWQAGDDANDRLTWETTPADWQDEWHHFAFIKNENAGTMRIYFDANEVASSADVNVGTLAVIAEGATRFSVGAQYSHGNDFVGKIDDFRIYDYELSRNEILDITICYVAWSPSPYNGEEDVPRDVVLTWRPGDFASSHDVYFGTKFDDVNEGTGDTFKGNQALDANSYDPPGVLELNTTYYWRIDEVDDPCTWKGPVWSFTVANFLIVDDMESYRPVTNRIADTWIDGWVNWTGSEVSLGSVTDSPPSPVNGGNQSMIYAYDNEGNYGLACYSEADRTFDTPQDWIEADEADVKVLTLYFYGDPDNDASATEQMYVGLEDTRGTNSYAEVKYGYYSDEDMNDIKVDDWQEWNITLADFTGVNLEQVKKVYIGFGDRYNPVKGGNGTVYFDDIRLYPRKCVASRLKPEADINNDCVVDFDDLMLMGDDWLDSDVMFDEVTEPSSDGLAGWWKLDDGDGNTTPLDSSTYANHGTLEGDYTWVAGHAGSALDFDGGRVLVPDAPELRPTDVVSVCAWVWFSDSMDSARVVVKGSDNHETYGLEIDGSDELVFHIRDVNDNRHAVSEEVLNFDEWFHIAGTFDGDALRSYLNGVLVDDNNEPNDITLSQDSNDFAIGNRSDDTDKAFEGIIDDVRVYGRVLSQAEIAYLATDGTGLYLMVSAANLYDKEEPGQRTVNFRDYAALLNGWLEEQLWPPEE